MKKILMLMLIVLSTFITVGCNNLDSKVEKITETMNNLESYKMIITVRNKDNGIETEGYARVTEENIYFNSGSEVYFITFVDGESVLIQSFYHTFIMVEDNVFDFKREIPVVRFGDIVNVEYDKVNNRYFANARVEEFDDVEDIIFKMNDTHITYIEFTTNYGGTDFKITLEFSEFDEVEVITREYISNEEKEAFEGWVSKIGFFLFYDNRENLQLEYFEGEVDCRLSSDLCTFDIDNPVEYNITDKTITYLNEGVSTTVAYTEYRSEDESFQALLEIIKYYYSQYE